MIVISGQLDPHTAAGVQVVDKPFSLSKIGRAVAVAVGRGRSTEA